MNTCRKAHDIKDPVQLIVMVGITGLNVFLSTVEDRLWGQKLSKDTANRPDICEEKRKSLNLKHTF